jgi:heme exporter protein D
MYFDSWQAALVMDGHGGFVWAAYAITTLGVIWMLVYPAWSRRRALRQLAVAVRREQARADSAQGVR